MELSDIVGLNKAERKLKDSLAFKLGIDLNIGDLTTLNQAKDEFKNYVISNALARNNYNVTAAAKELGIDRKTIQRRKDSQDQSLKLYAGEEAIKNAIYKVLNHYLPDTPKDNKLLDLKAKELSTYIQQNKKTLDEATKIFETYLVDLTVKVAGDKDEAAEKLNVSTRTINRKLREIKASEFYNSISYN